MRQGRLIQGFQHLFSVFLLRVIERLEVMPATKNTEVWRLLDRSAMKPEKDKHSLIHIHGQFGLPAAHKQKDRDSKQTGSNTGCQKAAKNRHRDDQRSRGRKRDEEGLRETERD